VLVVNELSPFVDGLDITRCGCLHNDTADLGLDAGLEGL